MISEKKYQRKQYKTIYEDLQLNTLYVVQLLRKKNLCFDRNFLFCWYLSSQILFGVGGI